MISKRGFTLLEIVVVLGIMAIVGLFLTQIFFSTIRGSGKSQVTSAIKQNGQAAIEAMDKTIRGSDKVVEVCSSGNGMVIYKSKSETSLYTRFVYQPATNTQNGYIFQDNATDCAATEEATSLKLTDTNTKTGVSIVSPGAIFSVNSLAGTGSLVTINFQVKPGVDVQSVYSDIDPVPLKTTIQLRSL
jgi:prepilin-type N-terminal cleavage/methylation domain-containing protein